MKRVDKPVFEFWIVLFVMPRGLPVTKSTIVFPGHSTRAITYSVIFCPTSTSIQSVIIRHNYSKKRFGIYYYVPRFARSPAMTGWALHPTLVNDRKSSSNWPRVYQTIWSKWSQMENEALRLGVRRSAISPELAFEHCGPVTLWRHAYRCWPWIWTDSIMLRSNRLFK